MQLALATIGVVTVLVASNPLIAQDTSSIPQEVIDDWSYFIGDWDIDGHVRDARVTGTASFKWAQGKHSYIGQQVWTIGGADRVIHLSLVGGWDSSKNQSIEHGFDSSGGFATVRYEVKDATAFPDSKAGEVDGYSRRGGAWSGKTSIERSGPDKYLLTTTVDGNRLHALTFQKKQSTE